MEQLTAYIKEELHYSDYQVEMIKYVLLGLFYDISKAILLGIYFYHFGLFVEFLCSLFVLLFLRWNTGGIHFNHYFTCLLATSVVFVLAIQVFPTIAPSIPLKMVSLILCIGIIKWIGPISSPRRPKPSEELKKICTKRAVCFVILLGIIIFIYPDSNYTLIGYWTIILQALQLVIGKIISEGRVNT